MLIEQARRRGEGEEGWREEWEKAVDELVERSEGWRCDCPAPRPNASLLIRHNP